MGLGREENFGYGVLILNIRDVDEIDLFEFILLKGMARARLYAEGLAKVCKVVKFRSTEMGADGCVDAVGD